MTTHDNDDRQPVSTSRRSSLALTLKEDPTGTGADAKATQEKASTRNLHDDNDTLVIDWEGPDDPENPKKRVLVNYMIWYTTSYGNLPAGLLAGNGWQHSLFRLSPSSAQYRLRWLHQQATTSHGSSILLAPFSSQ